MRETERLAEAISDLRYHNLPSDVVETAKVCLLDVLGVTLAGARHGLSPNTLVSIRVAVSRLSVENAPVGEPITGLEGKFSLTHAAAQALAEGHADEADFVDTKMASSLLASLRRRVQITTDPNLGWPEATVEIQTTDGQCLVERVDLRAKAVDLAAKRRALSHVGRVPYRRRRRRRDADDQGHGA